jgi:hypothetical protein
MPMDMFDGKHEHAERVLLGNFIKHSKDPYLEMKRSQDIQHTLIKAKYLEHPML